MPDHYGKPAKMAGPAKPAKPVAPKAKPKKPKPSPTKGAVSAAFLKALKKAGLNPHKVMAAHASVAREFK